VSTRLRDSIRNLIDLNAPLEDLEPLQVWEGPLLPEPKCPTHIAGCGCMECWNQGLRYGEYLKAKRLQEI
jgi:hypothetical protein